VVFVTLEDETGVANLIFYTRVFEAYRHVAQHSQLLLVRGKVERQDPKPGSVNRNDPLEKNGVASIVHVIVESVARLELVNPPGPLTSSTSPDTGQELGVRLKHHSRDFR
jgi:error-prone DNA polymerase